jgi:hypothetical protein
MDSKAAYAQENLSLIRCFANMAMARKRPQSGAALSFCPDADQIAYFSKNVASVLAAHAI